MSYSASVQRSWEANRLTSVLLELTYACNWDCVICYNDLTATGRPLSKPQYFKLLEELASMNVLNVALSGGEPLAHPHFFELGAEARRLGFVVRIKSNAHALRRPLAERLRREVDPQLIDVSLHGATAQTHDRQTRVTGSFVRFVNNVRTLRELGMRVKVNIPLTRWAEPELEDMIALCDDLDVTFQVDTHITPRDDGDRAPTDLAPSSRAQAKLADLMRQRSVKAEPATSGRIKSDQLETPAPQRLAEKRSKKNCAAGASAIAVDPFGDVLPCVQWRHPIGNLHQHSLRDIWTSASVDAVRTTSEQARMQVERWQEEGKAVTFCPGAAHAYSGDPLASYPYLDRQAPVGPQGPALKDGPTGKERHRHLPVLE